jgi:hypothetical protein
MDARTTLDPILDKLSDERMRQLIDFARFLASEDERNEWRQFGQTQIARAYGADEPEYSLADIRPGAAE